MPERSRNVRFKLRHYRRSVRLALCGHAPRCRQPVPAPPAAGAAQGRYHRRMSPTPLSSIPTAFPTESASFLLDGPGGKLETITDVATRNCARRGVAVVCHPQPEQGGTMHNKVVTMAERALRESGLDTLRFNFRGTGNSTGTHDGGP